MPEGPAATYVLTSFGQCLPCVSGNEPESFPPQRPQRCCLSDIQTRGVVIAGVPDAVGYFRLGGSSNRRDRPLEEDAQAGGKLAHPPALRAVCTRAARVRRGEWGGRRRMLNGEG